MALTSTKEYITHRNLKDIYPGLNEYDTKKRIYNWETTGTSNLYLARNCGLVTQLYVDGEDLGDAEANSGVVNVNGEWYYDSNLDTVYYFNSASSPNDLIVEAGEDWATLVTRIIRRASRMVESMLDSRMAREIMKDREGNYPEFIQRAVGLKGIMMLMQTSDPENPVIDSFDSEFNDIIEGYRSGKIQLPNAVTADSSKGVIREVSVNGSSDLRPVELTGEYGGAYYELLKIYIESGEGGIIGTAKMSVYGKGNDQLKNELLVDSETITGDFQHCGVGNLYIRWSGDDVVTAICTATDEYEIELWGTALPTSVTNAGSVTLTRRS